VVAVERHAERGRHQHVGARHGEGLRQHLDDAGRDGSRLGRRVDPLDQDDELIAAEARHRVARAHKTRQAATDLHQQLITRGVAKGVVHHLEVVEIEEHQSRRARCASRAIECVAEPIQEKGPVGETGQRVVERLPGEASRRFGALGDVPGVGHDSFHCGVVEPVRGRDLHVPPRSVRRDDACVHADHTARRVDEALVGIEHCCGVVGMEELDERPTEQRHVGMAEQALRCRAGVDERAIAAEDADEVSGLLDERREPRLGRLELVSDRSLSGDIGERGDDAGEHPVDVAHRLGGHAHDHELAVLAPPPDHLVSHRLTGDDSAPDRPLERRNHRPVLVVGLPLAGPHLCRELLGRVAQQSLCGPVQQKHLTVDRGQRDALLEGVEDAPLLLVLRGGLFQRPRGGSAQPPVAGGLLAHEQCRQQQPHQPQSGQDWFTEPHPRARDKHREGAELSHCQDHVGAPWGRAPPSSTLRGPR